MPKYLCTCGYVLNLSQGWSECEFTLVSESAIETLGGKLDGGDKVSSEQMYEVLDEKAITVYRCPQCRRLHLEGEVNKFSIYALENLGD